jgi:putative sigma-54 modulation protein
MELNIKATNMELTDAIRAFVQEKMNSLDVKTSRFGDVVRGEVEVGKTTNHHQKGDIFRAEVHVRLPGKLVYAEAVHDDLYTAINDAKKEAERQIIDYKEEVTDHRP